MITPNLSRAARALASLTQEALAEAAGVSLATVRDFETGHREISDRMTQKLQAALEKAGVQFIPENGGGAGVRLKNRRHR